MKTIFVGALLICIALVSYSSRKRKGTIALDNIEKKRIEGVLNFDNVIGWFKTLHLDQETDTPFIANPKDRDCLKEKMGVTLNIQLSSEKNYLLLGVYNSKDNIITHSLLIEADLFDGKTTEVLGNEAFVVLK